MLFTAGHVAEFFDSYVALTPQELVLLYVILETGVWQVPYDALASGGLTCGAAVHC